MKGEISDIRYKEAINFLLPRHYSGRKPQIKYALGWFIDNELKAVCTIGKPASAPLCKGICGIQWSGNVYELNRLCRTEDFDEPLSHLVSCMLKKCKLENMIIVSYSDTGMGHNGYVYQACNFIYTGITKERTDKYTEGNKHCRHYDDSKQGNKRKLRTAKHRYVYFCGKDRREISKMKKALKYPILPYPKGKNKNYILGEYQKPIIIESRAKTI